MPSEFDFYRSSVEPSSPAYEMLLRAELERANQMAHFFDPTQRAIETNARNAQVSRELAARERALADEKTYRAGELAIQQGELGLGKEKLAFEKEQMQRERESADALSAGLSKLLMPPQQPVPTSAGPSRTVTPGGEATPFPRTGAAVTRPEPQYSAQSVLYTHPDHFDVGVPDPEDLARIKDPRMKAEYINAWNTIHDNFRQREDARDRQTARDEALAMKQQAIEDTHTLIDQAGASGAIPKESVKLMHLRASKDPAGVGKQVQAKVDEHVRGVGFETMLDTTQKKYAAALKEDRDAPQKLKQIDMLVERARHSVLPYEEREKELNANIDKVLDIGKEPKSRFDTLEVPTVGKMEVPPFVSDPEFSKGATPGGLPRPVDDYVMTIAHAMAAHDPRLMAPSAKYSDTLYNTVLADDKTIATSLVVEQYPHWKKVLGGPTPTPLPPEQRAPAGSQPGQGQVFEMPPRIQLSEFTREQREEMRRILLEKGDKAAADYIDKTLSEKAGTAGAQPK